MPEDLKPIEEGESVVPEQPDAPSSYGGGAEEDDTGDPAAPRAPNSFYLPFGRWKKGERIGYISWQSDNPIAVLALVILVLIVVAILLLGLIDALTPSRLPWIAPLQGVLGQAFLTVSGAIMGAAAASARGRKKKRP